MKKTTLFFSIFSFLLMSFSIVKNEPVNEAKVKIENELFARFLENFEKVELPFSISLSDLGGYGNMGEWGKLRDPFDEKGKAAIANYGFLPGIDFEFPAKLVWGQNGAWTLDLDVDVKRYNLFSRRGPTTITRDEYLPVAYYFGNDEKSVAVIYSIKPAMGATADKSFYLANYDLEGNFLGGKINGQQLPYPLKVAYSSIEKSGTCTIDEKGHIWLNSYKNHWQKEVKKKGVVENEIVDYALLETDVYRFDSDGFFIEMKEYPTIDRASLY